MSSSAANISTIYSTTTRRSSSMATDATFRCLSKREYRSTQAFVALTGNAETNILACLTAKRMGVRKTVAAVENVDYVSMAESLDIGTIINKKTIAASYIYQMMLDADVMNVTLPDERQCRCGRVHSPRKVRR